MTTIAYNHAERKIAVDGRMTEGRVICTDTCKKYTQGDGFIMIWCGQVSHVERMFDIISTYNNGDIVELESEVAVSAFVVKEGVVYQCSVSGEGEYVMDEVTYTFALGTGEQFAMAAMDLGKTAKQAVQYAMTRDSGTGGKISVCDVSTGKIK